MQGVEIVEWVVGFVEYVVKQLVVDWQVMVVFVDVVWSEVDGVGVWRRVYWFDWIDVGVRYDVFDIVLWYQE